MIVVGGKGGLNPRKYNILAENLNENQVMYIINKVLKFYKENAIEGERFTSFIDRVSIEILIKYI